MPKNRGFTLVELLVVIFIIAILSTIGFVMYGTVQKSARIAKRIEDLKVIQTALELYYSVNKAYPSTGTTEPPPWAAVPAALVPTYMPAIPSDPSNGSYFYASLNGVDYKLRASGATEVVSNDYASQRNLLDPARDGGTSCYLVDGTAYIAWAIYSSNTNSSTNNPACW